MFESFDLHMTRREGKYHTNQGNKSNTNVIRTLTPTQK